MSMISLEEKGKCVIIRLNNTVTNAISPDLLDEFTKALQKIENQFEGMILAGGKKFFSIGFDLPDLLKQNRVAMKKYFHKFNESVLKLFTLPLPTVCAISGHAIAGGNILALTCDYRFSVSGKKFIGLNEIKLGVPVPYLADLMLRQIIDHRSADKMLFGGDFMTTSEAKRIGLVDEIYSEEEVEAKAAEKVSEIAVFPRQSFIAMKENRVETIRQKYVENYKSKTEIFLDCWFSKEARKLLLEAASKF